MQKQFQITNKIKIKLRINEAVHININRDTIINCSNEGTHYAEIINGMEHNNNG